MTNIVERQRTLLLILAVSLCAVGIAGTGTSGVVAVDGIPGCAPLCLSPATTVPGPVPAGKYKTRYFFAGQMTLTFPKGWVSGEDSTGEFWASPGGDEDTRLIFWQDLHAVAPVKPFGTSVRTGPVRRSAASLLGWMQKNPNLHISKPVTGKIGTIPARVTDISISAKAVNDDPGCPFRVCANFLGFPQWGEPYGLAGKAVTRFYLAEVRYGGQRHQFISAIEAVNKSNLNAFLTAAKKVIATVRVPATPG